MNRKIKERAKIASVLVLALFFSILLGTAFFGGNTPRLNTEKGLSFSQTLRGWINRLALRRGESSRQEEAYDELGKVAFSPVSAGVSAREKENTTETKYELDKIVWVEYSYTLKSGKTIILKVPQGKTPPPQSFADMME